MLVRSRVFIFGLVAKEIMACFLMPYLCYCFVEFLSKAIGCIDHQI